MKNVRKVKTGKCIKPGVLIDPEMLVIDLVEKINSEILALEATIDEYRSNLNLTSNPTFELIRIGNNIAGTARQINHLHRVKQWIFDLNDSQEALHEEEGR